MKVALEVTVLELDPAGTASAARGLSAALRARDDVEVLDIPHSPDAARHVARRVDRELRWFWLGLPRAVRRLRADLLHLPVALGPWRGPVPLVVTAHDVIALEHPEWLPRPNAVHQRLTVRRLARAGHRVLLPSRNTAERLQTVPGVEPERIRGVPRGVDSPFAAGARIRPCCAGSAATVPTCSRLRRFSRERDWTSSWRRSMRSLAITDLSSPGPAAARPRPSSAGGRSCPG